MSEVLEDFVQDLLSRVEDADIDECLATAVRRAMSKKLRKKRKDGYTGWSGQNCSNENLLEDLRDHVGKGDMVDVINLAAMIYLRTQIYGNSA